MFSRYTSNHLLGFPDLSLRLLKANEKNNFELYSLWEAQEIVLQTTDDLHISTNAEVGKEMCKAETTTALIKRTVIWSTLIHKNTLKTQ